MSHSCTHDSDDHEDRIISDVKQFGWSVVMIEATDYAPSFAYTIGLWRTYKHPELIAFGLNVKTLHLLLNDGGELIKEGKVLTPYKDYSDFFEDLPVQVIPVDPASIKDYFGYAIWFHSIAEFPAMQLVWTDLNKKFPWEPGFEEEYIYRQPLLDRNADFKFREEKNLGIFTTRQWLEENKPIIRVVHDDDGDWQFLTGDQVLEDMKLVCLSEVVARDKTLNEVFNLGYGEYAERDFIGSNWEKGKIKSEA